MELEVFFTIIQQTYSKLVISLVNRKSSFGYATHFLFFIIKFLNLEFSPKYSTCRYFLGQFKKHQDFFEKTQNILEKLKSTNEM
jgi:hypothetical protein